MSSETVKAKCHLKNNQRFPRLFKEAARIIKEVKNGDKSIKGSLYTSKLPGPCLRKVYGLVCSVMNNLHLIDEVIQKAGLLSKMPQLKEEAVEIMVHELVIKEHCLPGKSKPIEMIKTYMVDIRAAYEDCKDKRIDEKSVSVIGKDKSVPKYARVNSLQCSMSDVIEILSGIEFQQLQVEPDISWKKYREVVKNLRKKQFLQDAHFPDVLVFSNEENLIDLPLRRNFHILLQDKASCIAAYALNPPTNSIVLDCCAAPGMKTVHLASIMKNSGQIYALDKDKTRFSILEKIIKDTGAKNCKAICTDFLNVDPTVHPYSKVQYILLDPSCSGSGMTGRFDSSSSNSYLHSEDRIQRLSNFQISMLKHALSFPSVKRIVYSTCSIHKEENEYVVSQALQMYTDKFSLIKLLPNWKPRGSEEFSFGDSCIRASPKKNLTNGFFVAAFEKCSDI